VRSILTLARNEQKALDLKPGEVSEVVDLPDAFVILKLKSTKTVPGREPRILVFTRATPSVDDPPSSA
jgi:hypothetical protein